MSALNRPTTQADLDVSLARRRPTEAELRAAVLAWLDEPSSLDVGTMRAAIAGAIDDVAEVFDVAAFEVLESSDPASRMG